MGTIVTLAVRSASGKPAFTAPEIAERAVMMCSSTLFTGLTRRECEEIATHAQAQTFENDQILYMEGQTARNLALIFSGSVKLSRLGPNGNEVILWMAKPGDTIGVLADSLTRSHTCSARAMEPSKLLVWDFGRLQRFLEEYPQIRVNIGAILSNRLNELEERFREVATEKVDKRVAMAILRMAKQIGKPAHGGIEVPLTREELAQMTGTTLFSISRLLSKWGEEGFVLPRREAVVVLDAKRLGKAGSRGA
ncbi:MAG: Crp/Fnr family transcriptional regulator [Terracidiphilus sp.]|jgi:CRP-like cAMP-binding protein